MTEERFFICFFTKLLREADKRNEMYDKSQEVFFCNCIKIFKFAVMNCINCRCCSRLGSGFNVKFLLVEQTWLFLFVQCIVLIGTYCHIYVYNFFFKLVTHTKTTKIAHQYFCKIPANYKCFIAEILFCILRYKFHFKRLQQIDIPITKKYVELLLSSTILKKY